MCLTPCFIVVWLCFKNLYEITKTHIKQGKRHFYSVFFAFMATLKNVHQNKLKKCIAYFTFENLE